MLRHHEMREVEAWTQDQAHGLGSNPNPDPDPNPNPDPKPNPNPNTNPEPNPNPNHQYELDARFASTGIRVAFMQKEFRAVLQARGRASG